jgi:hypothetical protein
LAHKWFIKNINKFHSLSEEQQNKSYVGVYFLHGIESLIVVLLLSVYISPFFIPVFIGFLFHLFLDLIYEKVLEQRIDKISFIYNCVIFRNFIFIEKI